MGELFGAKLTDEGSEDSDGQPHRPRFDIDLDSGKVQLSRPAAEQPVDDPNP